MPSSSLWGLRASSVFQPMCGIFSAGIARRDLVDLAGDPAEPRRHLVFAAALGHELHADADAEERPALAAHGFLERRDHARHRVEAAAAIGERADARQHHALGAAHRRPDRASPRSAERAALARGALERLRGGVQIAGAVIDDGDAHASDYRRTRLRLGEQADDVRRIGRRAIRRRRGRRRAAPAVAWRAIQASKKRRSADSSSSATTTP